VNAVPSTNGGAGPASSMGETAKPPPPPPAASWDEANQRHLTAALAAVQALLDAHRAGTAVVAGPPPDAAARLALADATKAMPRPAALDTLARAFALTPFERDVVVLCAGVELDAGFAASCAAAQGDAPRAHPTFSLALAVLPEPHWSALSPASPLRRFRLVELGPGDALTASPLRIDERVLHHLAGVQHVDDRLAGLLEPVRPAPTTLVPSHRALVSRIVALWQRAAANAPGHDGLPWRGPLPIVQLAGPDAEGKRALAAAACAAIGATLHALPAMLLGAGVDDLVISRLLSREAALSGAAFLLDCDDLDTLDAPRAVALSRLLDRTAGPLLVTTRERRRLSRRPTVILDVDKPTAAEQRTLWTSALAAAGLAAPAVGGGAPASSAPAVAPTLDLLVSQFDLGAAAIDTACAAALADPDPGADPGRVLWDACRSQARPRLDDLAQRIEATAGWDDLVLPESHRDVLREVAVHVRQRAKVYETWGFGAKGARGLGVSALFAGASGTGKTMAAEVLAGTLRLDLYRIDLSQVVSKYIGETEKNLRRVFDAAEEAAAILLFDEADALFGKRSEVKDSHDRYANIEVSYLLQRMESYRGLAILTTNLKSALDTAFLRRIRFVVQFPFPDAAQRAEIWRRVFAKGVPTAGLDAERLAKMNVAGGNIRNIAVNAAFLAAEAGGPVRMAEVMRAARGEYAKMERPMTVGELEG
jgi:ATPase family associated with various cellular activities (AAA)